MIDQANIRLATIEDVPAIWEIKNSLLLNQLKNWEKGFLTVDFTKEEYELLVWDATHFYVCETAEKKIVGYLVCDRYDDEEGGWDLFVEQVGVDLDHNRMGVGKALYERLFDEVDDETIYLSIMTDPENTTSIAFHKQLGFEDFSVGVYNGIPCINMYKIINKKQG